MRFVQRENSACLGAPRTSLSPRHTYFLSRLFNDHLRHAFLPPGSSGRGSVTGHAPRRSCGAPQNRPFPQLNLHKARVRRTHGQPRPNGFTERARNSLPPCTPQPERASGKALA
jgi:hypothetical protein